MAKPGLGVCYLGVHATLEQPDDPENTLQVALTMRNLALISFGAYLAHRLFPELGDSCDTLMTRLMELSAYQEFLPIDKDDWDEIRVRDED